MTNILTVNLEDWYQRSDLDRYIGRESWEYCQNRLEASTYRLLALMSEAGVKATFFVLGWNVERNERLVREIARCGHEIAAHGYHHARLYEQTPVQFAWELAQCQNLVGSITGRPPRGYRAPAFSLVRRSLWALDALHEYGFEYDSSVFSVHHRGYGVTDSPGHPYRIALDGRGSLVELPIPTATCLGWTVGFSGGEFFRLLPYRMIARNIARLNAQSQPAVCYLHPWDIDVEQPRLRLPWSQRLRLYGNLEQTEAKLRRLLREFEFAPAETVLDRCQDALPCYRLTPGAAVLRDPSFAYQ